MIRKRAFVVVGLLALASTFALGGCATTQSKTSETPADVVDEASSAAVPADKGNKLAEGMMHPLVWTIEREGLPTSYLAGSIHLLDASTAMPTALEEAWKATESLVVEVDIVDPQGKAALQELMQKRMMLPPAQSLATMLSPQLFAELQKNLTPAGIPPQITPRLRPWVAMLIVTVARLQASSYSPDLGVDTKFLHRAKAANRTILSLESPAEQIDALASAKQSAAIRSLEQILEMSNASFDQEMGALVGAWRRGDGDALLEITFEDANDDKEMEAYLNALIFDRNVVLARRSASALEDNRRHLILVGAAHVVGPKSVVNELRARGFTVTRVAPEVSNNSDSRRR